MKKNILILLLLTSGLAYGQTKAKKIPVKKTVAVQKPISCEFAFEVDSTLKEKTYLLISYLTDGTGDVFHSTQLREKFATILQTKIPINKEYFVTQFKDICTIDKCVLQKVGVYRMSTPGEVMMIVTYNEKK